MGFRIVDEDGLAAELHRLSQLRFDAVILKNMAQIYNRGKADGGTPVDTGQLRLSLSHSGETVGYSKAYAPHVEFGHRLVHGGYVQGQRFLKRNVDAQRPIFAEDLRKQLRRF